MASIIRITAISIIICMMFWSGTLVIADDDGVMFYKERKTGWWWYQDPKQESKNSEDEKLTLKPIKVVPSIAAIPDELLWNLHPDQFQELLLAMQKKAVQNPTERAMADYTRMLDMARRKSVVFANASMLYVQQHPEYDVAAADPITTPGRVATTKQTTKAIEDKIKWAVGSYGLIYFYSQECQYCEAQTPILKYFAEKYNWEIQPYDTKIDTKVAQTFNVTVTPTILIVGRKNGEYLIVSSGVVSLPDMEERIYRGVRLLEGETNVENYSTYDYQKGGVLDPPSIFLNK
ncbi:MAG: conjugal transfer protein TraF [Deltaproteobacteria bacterium HGW-Deltaproteobacteria-12]|jgi:conjugal transfer pilus assembly protein TraF|nr:MAG: conjugal transfer protein TraF [Deltaproteobacteria bacterium HGW-Deltaproteobacteria-12]